MTCTAANHQRAITVLASHPGNLFINYLLIMLQLLISTLANLLHISHGFRCRYRFSNDPTRANDSVHPEIYTSQMLNTFQMAIVCKLFIHKHLVSLWSLLLKLFWSLSTPCWTKINLIRLYGIKATMITTCPQSSKIQFKWWAHSGLGCRWLLCELAQREIAWNNLEHSNDQAITITPTFMQTAPAQAMSH